MRHLPAAFRVTLRGLLAPIITMRSIQDWVENWASGSRLLWSEQTHEIMNSGTPISVLILFDIQPIGFWAEGCETWLHKRWLIHMFGENSHHSHRRQDVVGQGKLPVDELLLLVVEGVSVVDVQLALCSVLSGEIRRLSMTSHSLKAVATFSRHLSELPGG